MTDGEATDAELGIDLDAFQKEFLAAVAAAPSADARRWMIDVARRAQSKADREYAWCQQLYSCCEVLTAEADEPHWSMVEIFWPRALGVMTELAERHEKSIELASEAGKQNTIPVIALRVMVKAIQEMKVAASANEAHAVAIDYFRQRACHLAQRKFALQWDRPREKMESDKRTNPINGKTYTVAEMDSVLSPFYSKASDEAFIAADVAEVLKPHAAYLVYGLMMLRNPEDLREIVKVTREGMAEGKRIRDALKREPPLT